MGFRKKGNRLKIRRAGLYTQLSWILFVTTFSLLHVHVPCLLKQLTEGIYIIHLTCLLTVQHQPKMVADFVNLLSFTCDLPELLDF